MDRVWGRDGVGLRIGWGAVGLRVGRDGLGIGCGERRGWGGV